MDLLPSTVANGDRLTLRITRTAEGRIVPSDSECRLFVSGDTNELEEILGTREWVEADVTVTSCKWAAGDGSDMLFVSLNGLEPIENPGDALSTGAESSEVAATPDTSTESEGGEAKSRDSSKADRPSQCVGSSTDAVDEDTETPGETLGGENEPGSSVESSAADTDIEDVPPASVDEAAAVSDGKHREIDWDGDAPLDTDLLQRIVNGGYRVPTAEEHVELDHGERTAIEITTALVDLANNLTVSAAVCYCAGELYADAMQHDLIRGKSKLVTAAASVRLATLIEEEHRPLAAIEAASDGEVSTKEIADKERRMVAELGLDPTLMLIPPQKYIPYLIHALGVEPSASIVSDAREIAVQASSTGSGSSPLSTAAAAVYAAGLHHENEKFTQQQVAEAANTSEVTIRNNYKELSNP
ncbi:hypothetical protein DJ82_06620 [Halorubrum sp. Ib24]|uniref:transcription initiation factor IIB family protein n=1 Tax=Halorubrum sp. Ib24 TaxID=1383850 RepID=UPI000B97E65F|nr:transcription initiation factor IIB family protein [Halorubrum sp. Ib24]OYR40760.1 hypothetical protein DJ82_06620 [Halorubrum sp. Ib24]